MDMTAEAIQKAADLAAPKIEKVGELTYCIQLGKEPKYLEAVKKLHLECLQLNTLSGLVDYLKTNPDKLSLEEVFIHIENFQEVTLRSKIKEDKERDLIVKATAPDFPFKYGQLMDKETFFLNIQSQFQKTPEREEFLGLISSVAKVNAVKLSDSGYSQEVTTKQGSNHGSTEIKNPITLTPFRTFLDVSQPPSDFIYRMEAETLRCMLIEADGGAWKLAAVENIKAFLAAKLPDMMIVA